VLYEDSKTAERDLRASEQERPEIESVDRLEVGL
jgi:hypothetical protein